MIKILKPIELVKNTNKIDNELAKMEWYNNLSIDYKKLVKNSILGLYNSLTGDDYKQIFLKILKYIVVVNIDEYEELVIACYKKLRREYKNIKKIIIQPLQTGNEKIKSGTFVSYLFNSHKLSRVDEIYNFTNIPIVIKNQLSDKDDNKNTLIVLVDDFIGSGNSAKNSVKYFINNYKIDNLAIIALTCMTEGYKNIKDINIPIFYGKKVITIKEVFNDTELENAKKVISLLNSKYKFKSKNYLFGYKESMSTIITLRTPNNNLPFIWSGKFNKNTLFKRNENK
ncbi:Uncharacterised protein [Mycobacteroides abscessus subsp. abscessus]|nr:Uncharacterised protein [Mycobacteroides abscessus subsp. abscessus]